MSSTKKGIVAPMPAHWPATARVKKAMALSGLSRSHLYRNAQTDEAESDQSEEDDGLLPITLLKAGRSTLVDCASLWAHLQALPRAKIRRGAK